MFENSVGKVFFKDSCLSIRITDILDKNDLHDFLCQFKEIYTSIDEPFSIDNGLLTPTLKNKRYKIIENYRGILESLYARK